MYNKYKKLKEASNVTDYRVAAETGIGRSTFTDWKNGRSEPKLQNYRR